MSGKPAAGFDRHDRFATSDAPRNSRKAPRIPEGLQVEEHDVGGRVVFPILQEIVRGDVGFISHAHE